MDILDGTFTEKHDMEKEKPSDSSPNVLKYFLQITINVQPKSALATK